ncbi:MAG TPA: methyltransferase domain-containing protein [Geothermobacteraceae bacterium]|nr:methyltransferase domain-containing protein [Geothermobacteraceae bacterium]
MSAEVKYLMEHAGECSRLEMKTRAEQVLRQASWAGIGEGMHVLDAGCGVGKTSSILKELVGDSGSVTGVDLSPGRLQEATQRYGRDGVRFIQHDLTQPFQSQPQYDAVWMRFLLEYFADDPLNIVRNAAATLKPGGIMVLADLESNSLNHHGLSNRLSRTIEDVIGCLGRYGNFDPFAGGKLYGHLYDLDFREIEITAEAHHLIYGEISVADRANWLSKLEVAAKSSGSTFAEYDGDFSLLSKEFKEFLDNPRRFIFTPIIICRGIKP